MLVEQRAEFDAWRADPRNQAALDAMYELWEDLAVLKGAAPSAPPALAPASTGRRYLVPIIAAAASLLFAVVVGAGWLLTPRGTTLQTAAGEQKTQSMPDGSLIAVNVASALSYRIRDNERAVTLTEGEAAFSVTPDAERPFVVRAGDFEVRAVGTAFNVKQRDGMIEVSVSEGTVQICKATGARESEVLATLVAGQRLDFPAGFSEPSFASAPAQIQADQVSEWRMRIVSYENTPVRDVIEDFNRYFERKLFAEDAEILSRQVTIRLRVDDRERAIETLAGLLGVRVERSEKGEILRN
jgi:transmembrane sensor